MNSVVSQHLHTGRQCSLKKQWSWKCKADCEAENTAHRSTEKLCLPYHMQPHTSFLSPPAPFFHHGKLQILEDLFKQDMTEFQIFSLLCTVRRETDGNLPT